MTSFDGAELYWQAAGPVIESPVQIEYGIAPASWVSQNGPVDIAASEPDDLYVVFSNYDGKHLAASFEFSDLREGQWVTGDGRYSDAPCPQGRARDAPNALGSR
ncbi:hypothetical protein [Herbiconiux ginsengi]|uniref:Uncharacterized protein n=1 Tax=Herbiconiux ginsengi TaxID=381665 RepID=A0A1H3SUX7_9MICO|nr:hypothetical protein [Herbiconiux ginsengi]SDZ41448.1 hypothetical protein SAMN05216554_3699 [Herbiconiux ginsengi]